MDDDKVFGFTFSKYLELIPEAGRVQVFRTAREALNFYEEWKDNKEGLPDIMMIDINPPAKTGWKFLESVSGIWHQLNKHPTIYMISSTQILMIKAVRKIIH
ncbi:MAG: hypothetical protein U5L96_05430 [Owenweeksia sp.]|nr:hypothetical protein [Owenweeksia sp.]